MPYNYNYNNYKVKQNKSFTRWVEDNLFDISIFNSVIARLIMYDVHLLTNIMIYIENRIIMCFGGL